MYELLSIKLYVSKHLCNLGVTIYINILLNQYV